MWTNQIGDEGAIALANNLYHIPQLRFLILWSNQIGQAGVTAIEANLNHSPQLRKLNIDKQQV